MTKEETICTLKNIAWLGTEETTEKNVKAVSNAIACVNALGYIKDYINAFSGRILEVSDAANAWKELSTMAYVKSFIDGYEKGIFNDK